MEATGTDLPPLRVAFLSESPADEAALAILTAGVLRRPVETVRPSLRARGWPQVLQILPAVVRHLHFHSPADLLVVVADTDDSAVHEPHHDAATHFNPRCRLCLLRAAYRKATRNLPPRGGRERVLRGIGVAVPAVEAWYLCGREEQVTEAAWVAGMQRGRPPYTRAQLKMRVYGTDRPSLTQETVYAEREARRHAHDPRRLEHDFPSFAALAADLRIARETCRLAHNHD